MTEKRIDSLTLSHLHLVKALEIMQPHISLYLSLQTQPQRISVKAKLMSNSDISLELISRQNVKYA